MIYLELILGFLEVGCFSFGGAYAAIPLIRDVVLKYGWMEEETLLYFIGVCESTPGPIMINLATYVGSSQAGILGALLATTMVVLPAFLIILGVCWFEPIVWLITNSFKFDADFITSFADIKGPFDYLTRMIPRTWTASNHTEPFFGGENVNTNANIGLMFQNSFIVSITVTVCTVFITSLSAFAYERLDFKGGDKIFWTLMYMSMFPNVVAILPQFRIANALGWVNNLNALIWPMLAGVFNIFLIRNFMKSIPKALDEAATIDGATSFQVYTKIILPLCKPMIVYQIITSFMGPWMDFILAKVIVRAEAEYYTVSIGLYKMLEMEFVNNWFTRFCAGAVVVAIPISILFMITQKCYQEAMGGAVKG